MRSTILALLSLSCLAPLTLAQQAYVDPYEKRLAKPSDDGIKAIPRIQLPKGLKAELFAAEPMLANPVAFCIDEQGRFYIAETWRHSHGVTDNRSHRNWLDDELASRTVADRIALYKKYKFYDSAGKEHDRVRLVLDTDGDGRADKASVFADGFHRPEDGLGAGLLARHGKVWYTCIPHLWLLQDTKGTGRADVKKSLHYGYGVHVAFIGHDLHGLTMGPDGKLYFSMGDRGLHVETAGRVVSFPDGGAVLRCNPDGSELEIVAVGLRNPQELAFDKYGNLFTGDNNADGGDKARWVYVVEGGDSGWRLGYQYLKNLGPWNAEKMWHLPNELQPAALVPPLAHIAAGPSGLTYDPGVSLLPADFRDHFFLVDFRGSSGGSGIHSFSVKPKGASFEVVGPKQFVWSLLATDCDFGPDGGFYVLDWVEGWNITGKGRIYKMFDPARRADPLVHETQKLLADGMARRSSQELARLLEHPDRRVRLEAQFALAERADSDTLARATTAKLQLARLHGIWGLGQIGRKKAAAYEKVLPLLTDKDAEVRAQAAKVLGDGKVAAALDGLVQGLKDAEPRVQFFSALALGKLGKAEAAPAVVAMLKANADKDAYLRHAGVMALTGMANAKALDRAAHDPSSSVRLAALLALRRLHKEAEVAAFLYDTDSKLVLEAARAIYDTPLPGAFPQLASLLQQPATLAAMPPALQEPLWLRVLNAHLRLGKKDNAQALAAFAASQRGSEKLRLEALELLEQWTRPSGRDRIVGLWRPLEPRPESDVAEALRPALAGLVTATPAISGAAVKLAARYGIKDIGPELRKIATDTSKPAPVRVETLKALAALKDEKIDDIVTTSLLDKEPRVRHQARAIRVRKMKPHEAAGELAAVLKDGAIVEKQGAFQLLADNTAAEGERILAEYLTQIGQMPPEIHLDLLEAARKRNTPELKKLLAAQEAAATKGDKLAAFRPALFGGDAEAGRKLFFEKNELSCVRCHKLHGSGGEVGPDLSGIGAKQKRDYLLQAIVDPSKEIAKGFETVVLVLTNGQVKSGILKQEDAKEVRLVNAEGQTLIVPKEQIEERSRGPSAMPADLIQKMTVRELRDLVEFLAQLR